LNSNAGIAFRSNHENTTRTQNGIKRNGYRRKPDRAKFRKFASPSTDRYSVEIGLYGNTTTTTTTTVVVVVVVRRTIRRTTMIPDGVRAPLNDSDNGELTSEKRDGEISDLHVHLGDGNRRPAVPKLISRAVQSPKWRDISQNNDNRYNNSVPHIFGRRVKFIYTRAYINFRIHTAANGTTWS